jgi:hypothetical protein
MNQRMGRRHLLAGATGLSLSAAPALAQQHRVLSGTVSIEQMTVAFIGSGGLGGGQLWLENPNGVIMSLRARRQGLAVSLGADAVVVAFK